MQSCDHVILDAQRNDRTRARDILVTRLQFLLVAATASSTFVMPLGPFFTTNRNGL